MRLGKFIGIMPADQAGRAIDQRAHRDLDEIMVAQPAAIDLKLGRMHDILGIMQHDCIEAPALPRLVTGHCLPDAVEAIGLRAWARRGHRHEPQTRIARRSMPRRIGGRRVVGIDADIEPVIVIRPARQAVRYHVADHLGLIPGGNENGIAPGLPGIGMIALARLAAVAQQIDQPDEIEREVVERSNQEPDTGE